ncbi:MAG: carboxypeptidase-like regulatory domain-containing protein [Ignavibacteria bacterium]|nr:carboxypeptidase-like regulatory domain-containing protein [Ignavibacteria bacterium]MBK6419655.1 carboxypeptidase-like regulatory domain-containing protein [Ignavibacteria bacterium]MBK7184603.1 carboxypeptidase-like regulatory domain-containing protein [Ignavibacteria bacterium]MBK7576908.1 carboxypeptidase-like regulatory domain-containing protein [Ignavibacteria bacterium]
MKHILTSLLFCASVIAASAQTGSIEGKVTDAETGEALRGASVGVVDTKKGAYSDTKGTFRIKKLAAGTYKLRVTFIGYETKVVEGIVVKDDAASPVTIVLGASVKVNKEVVVQASRVNDNAAALLAERKNAAQVSDGIGREEISKLPDSDAGQSLKRVSGVTLVEGKYVYVRGVSERYSNTTLNGASLSSTEPDKKAFAFDMFPAELLENANVTKSFTPDLPGNFSGGLVQLNTIDFPSAYSVKVSGSQSINDYVTFHQGEFLSYTGSSKDWSANGAGDRSYPADIPANREEFLNLNSKAQVGDVDAANRVAEIGSGFPNSQWKTNYETAPMNGGLGVTVSAPIEIGETDAFGIVANVNYGNTYSMNRMTRSGLQADRSLQFSKSGYTAARSSNMGGLLNLAYRLGESTTFSFKNVYNRSMDDESLELYGESYSQAQTRREFGFNYVQKELLTSQLGGEHTVGSFNNAVVNWKLGYSETQRDEPDYRRLQYSRQSTDTQSPLAINFSPSPTGDGTTAGRFYSDMSEYYRIASANVTLPVEASKIKFGGLYEFRNRDFTARSFTVIQSRNYAGDIDGLFNTSEQGQVDPSAAFADSNYSADRLMMSEETRLSDAYTASERLGAAYLMADIPFDLASVKMRFIGGARIESSLQQLNSFDAQDQAVNPVVDVTDVLPSLNLVISPAEDMNIRLGASQTLARPSLREFAPFSFYNFQIQAVTTGNPNLTRALIQNYDVRWEVFPNAGEVISVSAFYKTFTNAIEETILPSTSEVIYSFQNANGQAQNYGIEFEARKQLGFIASFLTPFTFSINAAVINSHIVVNQGGVTDERTMWGQSPYTVNIGLFYTNFSTGSSINLGYNTYGRRIIKVGQRGAFQFDDPHVYEMPRQMVDLSLSQNLGGNLELKFAIRDILNQPLYWEQGGVNIQSNIRGRTYTFGIGYRFN